MVITMVVVPSRCGGMVLLVVCIPVLMVPPVVMARMVMGVVVPVLPMEVVMIRAELIVHPVLRTEHNQYES